MTRIVKIIVDQVININVEHYINLKNNWPLI